MNFEFFIYFKNHLLLIEIQIPQKKFQNVSMYNYVNHGIWISIKTMIFKKIKIHLYV